jgi:ubiquinone/menaquinone biosynthesis C-methylase UbiE
MSYVSFDRISFVYDFFEKYILRDYQGSMDIIEKYLSIDKYYSIIDIGGGTGFFSKAINKKIRKIVVIDPSFKMLKQIKNSNLSIIQGDGCFLSIKDQTFDLALMVNVLHHIHKKKQRLILNEAFRVLKKTGTIFIIEVFPPKKLLHKIFYAFENLLVGQTYHLSDILLESYLKYIGFSKLTTKYPTQHSWKYVILGEK